MYIGEVYRRNISLNIEWDVNVDTSGEYKDMDMYNFLCYITSYKGFIGFNPFFRIPSAIKKRTGDKLYSHLIHNIKLFKERIETEEKPGKVFEFKGCQYNYFLFVKNGDLSLGEINRKLVNYYKLKCKRVDFDFFNETHLILTLDTGYNFHFSLQNGSHVQEEAKELGLNPNEIKTRIEFWGDADSDGTYLNAHLFILEQLESEKLSVFNISQGYFM